MLLCPSEKYKFWYKVEVTNSVRPPFCQVGFIYLFIYLIFWHTLKFQRRRRRRKKGNSDLKDQHE
jgi:hypothetical protein